MNRHIVHTALWLTLMVILASAPAAAAGKIVVRTRVEVAERTITVGAAAEISGVTAEQKAEIAARSLGPAPRPDQEVALTTAQMESRLYNAGIKRADFELQIPETVTIHRKASRVTGREIADFASTYLEQNVVWGGGPVRTEIKKMPEDLVLEYGTVTFEGSTGSTHGRFSAKNFKVDVLLDGTRVRTFSMYSYLTIYGDTVVAIADVPRKTILTEAEIGLEERELNRLPNDAIARIEDALGKQTKANLRAGDPVTLGRIEVEPDIERGEAIIINTAGDGFTISARGKALEKGFVGDLIQVTVDGSRKVIEAVITDDHTVEIVAP